MLFLVFLQTVLGLLELSVYWLKSYAHIYCIHDRIFFIFLISNFLIQYELGITAIQITCYIQNSITFNELDKIYLPDRTKSNTNNRGISWRSSCCVMVMTCLMNFLWMSSYSSYKFFIKKFYNGDCWNVTLKSDHQRTWIARFLQDYPLYKKSSTLLSTTSSLYYMSTW